MNLRFDPSLNILQRQQKSLDAIFYPKSVAVIGASEKQGSVGRTLLWNLLRSPFGGTVYPVNPKRDNVLGIKAFKSVSAIDDQIDLVVIATPAKFIPGIIEECVEQKVKAAIVISAGFKEVGEAGALLEEQVLSIAKKGNIRLIGPNCLGVMNPITGMNATFAADCALGGNIAFISQSGALCTAVLDWSLEANVGFSSFVSIGSMADIGFGDLIHYFGDDENTKSILIYMESIGDPRAFLSAARQVAFTKPIILIKAGRTEESALAAASHTGSLAGSDEVLNAALRRVGVLRVDTISDLFSMAEILSKQPYPKGPNLSIITNAGGPGVIATDALIENGGKLTEISGETLKELNKILPPQWSHNNPIDILGDASSELYAKSVEVVAKDIHTDGVLVILTPQDMTDPISTAEKLIPYAQMEGKPIFASWMGGKYVKKGAELLNHAKIPTFAYPDVACKVFAYMWRYSYNLKGIYETPDLLDDMADEKQILKRKEIIDKIIKKAREEGRVLLDEYESKRLLVAYDIPTVPTVVALSEKEAVREAEKLGFPIVLKLYSRTITHKTDVGGVKLNLNNSEAVQKAYQDILNSVTKLEGKEHFQGVTVQPMVKLEGLEIILGSSVDEQFGPVLLFGAGGALVEVFKDSALGLPPLNSTLATRMMEQTKVYEALKGVRGKGPIDFEALQKIVVSFSNLISEHLEIKEFDINPLIASEEKIIALDARVVLHEKDAAFPKLAIRPYPNQYVQSWVLKDKMAVLIRPIRPEDELKMIQFHKELSENTVRQRFLKMVHYEDRVAHDRLSHICFNDYDQEICLVVEHKKKIIAATRLTKISGTKQGTFSIIIQDQWQSKGIGNRLMELLLEIAKKEGIDELLAEMLSENNAMRALLEKFGFTFTEFEEKNIVLAKIDLTVF